MPEAFKRRKGDGGGGVQEGFYSDDDLDLLMIKVAVDDDELAGFLRCHFNIARCFSKTQIVGGELTAGARDACVDGVRRSLKR